MFKRLLLTAALSLALLTSSATGTTLVVDPDGGGDYDNIPEAAFYAAAGDTVLVLPGYYEVETSIPYPWPVPLTSDSTTLISRGGAAVTHIDGDGWMSAFVVPDMSYGARVHISGFEFSSLKSPFDWDGPSAGTQVYFTDNIVDGCEEGVDARWGVGLIARNTIEGLGICGVQVSYFNCTIEDNEIFGFMDAGEIAEMIWDCHESEWAGVCFIVDPWCTAPGCDATGAAGTPTSWGAVKAMFR